MQDRITILGIESSCDDTAAAVIQNGKILANVIANQDVHAAFGGVVPELASREHQKNIIPVVEAALRKANVSREKLDAVAFTRGPGLLGSLLVGTSFAKGFALSLGIPLVEVNHMKAHILAHFIEDASEQQTPPEFPFICLTVSGGHTQLVVVSSPYDMEIIGQTIDDAAGEAFDKVAKILGLPYPGGPVVDRLAKTGDAHAFDFAKPSVPGLNFSFSGLKTSFLYSIRKQMQVDAAFATDRTADLCASVQRNIIEMLMSGLDKAVQQTGITRVAIAGGVSANSELRNCLKLKATAGEWQVHIPKFEYCTDNAAMVAMAGYYNFLNNEFVGQNITPVARMAF